MSLIVFTVLFPLSVVLNVFFITLRKWKWTVWKLGKEWRKKRKKSCHFVYPAQ